MRFLVFGAGDVGSLVGGLLSRKHQVILVGRKSHIEAIRRKGLRIRVAAPKTKAPRLSRSRFPLRREPRGLAGARSSR